MKKFNLVLIKQQQRFLRCSKNLYNWDQSHTDNDKKASFYDIID